jgi:hypothetical protein
MPVGPGRCRTLQAAHFVVVQQAHNHAIGSGTLGQRLASALPTTEWQWSGVEEVLALAPLRADKLHRGYWRYCLRDAEH